MEITECNVKFCKGRNGPLVAYCNVVFDGSFTVRDIRIISSSTGEFIIAMPSKKEQANCKSCSGKNEVGVAFCNHCGKKLPPFLMGEKKLNGQNGKKKEQQLHQDIAHPITKDFRGKLQDHILQAYHSKASMPAKEPAAVRSVKKRA